MSAPTKVAKTVEEAIAMIGPQIEEESARLSETILHLTKTCEEAIEMTDVLRGGKKVKALKKIHQQLLQLAS